MNNKPQGTPTSLVTQKQVADDFDRLAEDYERQIEDSISFSGMEHSFFIDKKREKLVELANRQFGQTGSLAVLDLGCGLGGYHAGLEGVFGSLYGVDVSALSVEKAREKHAYVKYASYDGEHLPYPGNSFDVIYTITVMHHVPPAQWPSFVTEMYRVLKPGGLGLVFEHNPYNPATQYIVRSCEIDKDAVLLKPGKTRQLFKDAGFKNVYTHAMFSVPPKGGFLNAIDHAFGFLPFGAQYYMSATKP